MRQVFHGSGSAQERADDDSAEQVGDEVDGFVASDPSATRSADLVDQSGDRK